MRKASWAVLLLFAVLFGISCRILPPAVTPPGEQEVEPDDETEMEPIQLPSPGTLPVSSFGEVWAYVVSGREPALVRGLPITDVVYFSAEIDSYGVLGEVPNRRKLPAFFTGRVHLAVACNSSRGLTHFAIAPGSAERKNLIADLAAAARDFDGLQIDFELVPSRDGAAFLSFLEDMRAALGNKMFSVALPARYRKVSNDVYDYEKIASLVDRILVMAYDEHWAASNPGPIASLSWCRQVAAYSLSTIGAQKLVMGIPFYGRAWGDTNPSRALTFSGIEDVMKENHITEIRRETGIPSFDYSFTTNVQVYYEDAYSLASRMEMYKTQGVSSVGFWRLGQETSTVWGVVRVEKP